MSLSSTEEVFNKAAPEYNEALKHSGYDHTIKYANPNQTTQTNAKRNRPRTVIWFNPPYCESVKTKVGGQFLKLITKHFPIGHKLNKIFNRNRIKVSYSSMKNVKSVITTHNNQVIQKTKTLSRPADKTCNCRNKRTVPCEESAG